MIFLTNMHNNIEKIHPDIAIMALVFDVGIEFARHIFLYVKE